MRRIGILGVEWLAFYLLMFGSYGGWIVVSGAHPGVRGPTTHPYDTGWIAWTAGAFLVSGAALLVRARITRRRLRREHAEADRTRRARLAARHGAAEPPAPERQRLR